MNIPTDVLRTCTKTNKQTQLSLSLSCCLATFVPSRLLFGQSHSPAIQKEQLLLLLSPFSLYLSPKTTQQFLILHFCSTLRHFLCRACVCLKTHKLLGHLIVGPLREYPHDGEASFVHGDALHQGVAGGAAALVRQLSELDDRHADDTVLAGKAVVLY